MVRRMESTECTTLITRGDELARNHDDYVLIMSLARRLGFDGLVILGRFIARSAEEEASGPFGRSVFFAQALIGRLRVEKRGDLADAIISLLSGGSPDIDPVLWLNAAHAFIAMGREEAARDRARGLHERANDTEANAWNHLRKTLLQRLDADGREDLARAVSTACWAFVRQERGEEEPPVQPHVVAGPQEPPPATVALWALTDPLVHNYPADVLAYAAVARLRAEGRDILAASIMMFWAREHAGPIVDPGQVAAELCAELRAHRRSALADTIASLLSGVSIGRDPSEIMTLWLNELAGPMVDSGPLATALVAALRKERRGELADAVAALLNAGR